VNQAGEGNIVLVEVCVQTGAEDLVEGAGGEEPSLQSAASIAPETWEKWFQQWMVALEPQLSPIQSYELSLRLTGDREIQALNRRYRHQDNPTDVLAFAALEVEGSPFEEMSASLPLYLGDIVISVNTAQRQAAAQNHSLEIELAWLAAHGLLHLLGWDHPDDASLARMLNQQQALLQIVGLPVQTS
jgi:probable rRNA maturation factor